MTEILRRAHKSTGKVKKTTDDAMILKAAAGMHLKKSAKDAAK
jgi:hypothetical protein